MAWSEKRLNELSTQLQAAHDAAGSTIMPEILAEEVTREYQRPLVCVCEEDFADSVAMMISSVLQLLTDPSRITGLVHRLLRIL